MNRTTPPVIVTAVVLVFLLSLCLQAPKVAALGAGKEVKTKLSSPPRSPTRRREPRKTFRSRSPTPSSPIDKRGDGTNILGLSLNGKAMPDLDLPRVRRTASTDDVRDGTERFGSPNLRRPTSARGSKDKDSTGRRMSHSTGALNDYLRVPEVAKPAQHPWSGGSEWLGSPGKQPGHLPSVFRRKKFTRDPVDEKTVSPPALSVQLGSQRRSPNSAPLRRKHRNWRRDVVLGESMLNAGRRDANAGYYTGDHDDSSDNEEQQDEGVDAEDFIPSSSERVAESEWDTTYPSPAKSPNGMQIGEGTGIDYGNSLFVEENSPLYENPF